MVPARDIRWARVESGRPRREVADALLLGLLRERGMAHPRLTRVCAHCGGAHGAVRATEGGMPAACAVAVTYAGGWAIAAAAPAPGPFAIDAEPCRLQASARDRIRVALGDARADAATWTRVEAALKADGRGLRVDPAEVRLAAVGGGWAARVPGRVEPLFVSGATGPPGIVLSVAAGWAAASDRSTR